MVGRGERGEFLKKLPFLPSFLPSRFLPHPETGIVNHGRGWKITIPLAHAPISKLKITRYCVCNAMNPQLSLYVDFAQK